MYQGIASKAAPERSLNQNRQAMAVLPLTVTPFSPPAGSVIDFGAEIRGVDLENLDSTNSTIVARALD